ncbi:HNH endonuclease family protein [Rhizobium sp. RCAM05350]|nr:HNH endonuclease family protein [Rhizobium sp. RCAM05350]
MPQLDENGWSFDALAAFLLGQKSETGRFPRDEEFEQKWLSSPSYTVLQPARTRAVLEEIELAKRTKFHDTVGLSTHLSVEHVMPQNWLSSWPLSDGTVPTISEYYSAFSNSVEDGSLTGKIARRRRIVDSFGNLTLLTRPLNSSVSNGPYDGKRTALLEHSLLVLNKEVTVNEKWSEDVITERGRSLFATAKTIWKLPALQIDKQ